MSNDSKINGIESWQVTYNDWNDGLIREVKPDHINIPRRKKERLLCIPTN